MRKLRDADDITAEQLAERMTALGVPWGRDVVANLENGRRTNVAVDELFALALALNVMPTELLIDPDADRVPVTPTVSETPERFRAWLGAPVVLTQTTVYDDVSQIYADAMSKATVTEARTAHDHAGASDSAAGGVTPAAEAASLAATFTAGGAVIVPRTIRARARIPQPSVWSSSMRRGRFAEPPWPAEQAPPAEPADEENPE